MGPLDSEPPLRCLPQVQEKKMNFLDYIKYRYDFHDVEDIYNEYPPIHKLKPEIKQEDKSIPLLGKRKIIWNFDAQDPTKERMIICEDYKCTY